MYVCGVGYSCVCARGLIPMFSGYHIATQYLHLNYTHNYTTVLEIHTRTSRSAPCTAAGLKQNAFLSVCGRSGARARERVVVVVVVVVVSVATHTHAQKVFGVCRVRLRVGNFKLKLVEYNLGTHAHAAISDHGTERQTSEYKKSPLKTCTHIGLHVCGYVCVCVCRAVSNGHTLKQYKTVKSLKRGADRGLWPVIYAIGLLRMYVRLECAEIIYGMGDCISEMRRGRLRVLGRRLSVGLSADSTLR